MNRTKITKIIIVWIRNEIIMTIITRSIITLTDSILILLIKY